jgi:hypothetical protein
MPGTLNDNTQVKGGVQQAKLKLSRITIWHVIQEWDLCAAAPVPFPGPATLAKLPAFPAHLRNTKPLPLHNAMRRDLNACLRVPRPLSSCEGTQRSIN